MMKNSADFEVVILDIPSVGNCTLIPSYRELPLGNQTYETVVTVAKTLGLQELQKLKPDQIEEIFNALSYVLSGSDLKKEVEFGVVLSGVRNSYTSISTDIHPQENQKRKCVTLMDFCSWNKKNGVLTESPFPNHFEMVLDVLPIEESFDTGNKNILFTLFSGTYGPEE